VTRRLPKDIEAAVKANLADQEYRAKIRALLRGEVAAWGLAPEAAADLLIGEGERLKSEAEAELRKRRGRR